MAEQTARTKEKEPSANAKRLSARLMAVQIVFQALNRAQPLSDVLDEYLQHRLEMEVEGEKFIRPDGALLKKIVTGAGERQEDLKEVILANSGQKNLGGETLINAILLCGAFELMAHEDIETAIIINDYLNIGHSFFEQGEVKLLNGILDSIAKTFRTAG